MNIFYGNYIFLVRYYRGKITSVLIPFLLKKLEQNNTAKQNEINRLYNFKARFMSF